MKPYGYLALQPGEIRLLRLNPLRHADDTLSGSLFHHLLTNPTYQPATEGRPAYLEQPQSYEAISYHWGSDPATPHQLIVDEADGSQAVVYLTTSLNAVLRRLALPDQHRVLWADAICINQVNNVSNKEKGEQIQLMPDIYRVATRVQIYLGGEADDVPEAVNFINLLSEHVEELDEVYSEIAGIGVHLAEANGFVLPPLQDKRWPALRAFFRRPWFRRVWVIQEFVYAADITVTCGNSEIDWRRLYLAAKAYSNNRTLMFTGFRPDLWGTTQRDLFREAHEGARSLHTIADLRIRAWGYMSPQYMIIALRKATSPDKGNSGKLGIDIGRNFESLEMFDKLMRDSVLKMRADGTTFPFGRESFLNLLYHTRNFRATQPVDRLYALIGLADDADGLESIYSEQQTAEAAAQRFAVSFIERGKGADILSSAGMQSETPGIRDSSSWVPDWSSVQYAQDNIVGFNRLSRVHEGAGTKKNAFSAPNPDNQLAGQPDPETQPDAEVETNERFYRAALDTEFQYSVNPLDNTLTVKVTAVDIVLLETPGKLTYGTPMYANIVNRLGEQYSTGEPMEEALWRTMIGNRTFEGERPPADFALQYENLKGRERKLAESCFVIVLLLEAIAIPFIALAIYRVAYIFHGIIFILLTQKEILPYSHGAIMFGLIPFLRRLPFWLLIPVLAGFAWYALQLYGDKILHLLGKQGLTLAASTAASPPDCAELLKSFALTVNKYKLCATNKGLLALMPPMTRQGDILVIIHGCDAPFVLRDTGKDEKYRLVGECYVHGIMNGEAMDLPQVDVVLC